MAALIRRQLQWRRRLGNQAGTIAPGSGTEVITNIDSYNSAQRFLGELGGPVILKAPPYGFWFGDAAYRMTFTFPHTANSVTVVFSSSLNEGKGEQVHSTRDESWGLDNVRVTAR